MNGLISWWVRNSVAANLLMILIAVAGVASFMQVEREVFPSAKLDQVTVSVSWPGASPRDVEEQIILRIEEAISDVDNVDEINSTARESSATVTIDIREGAEFDTFLNEIKSKVDGISNLPQSSFPPVVRRSIAENGLTFIGLLSETVGPVELNRLALDLRDELATLPGGSPLVQINGEQVEEISVEVTETALRRYGLSFDDVANAIRGSSLNLSAGQVRTNTGNIPLAIRQLAETEEDFERIVVRRNRDGSVVTVGDLAEVKTGFEDEDSIYRIDGKPGVMLQVMQPETVNVVATSRVIEEWIDEKRASGDLPAGVEIKQLFTLSDLYFNRMELVSSNAIVGLLLVLGILMLFLRPTVAFWVATGIGISFVGTFIFMPVAGVSLNMLSLFALLLVIGIVVDDALIVGESIHRQTERGKKGIDAAIIGTQIVAKPVVFAVLTTMLAFSPFLLIGGQFADFTKHIAWTIMFALTFSLIESFLILPAHLAHLHPPKPGGIMAFQAKIADSLLWVADRFYRPLIKLSLTARYFTVTLFVMMFVLSVALLVQGWVQFRFFPDVEGDDIALRITMEQGTPFSRTLQVYDQVEAANRMIAEDLKERYGGQDVVSTSQAWAWSGGIFTQIILDPDVERTERMADVGDRWRGYIGEIPDAEEVAVANMFGGESNMFVVGLEGNDLEQLTAAVEEVKTYLSGAGELYDVRDTFDADQEELRFSLKPGAERFGLTLNEISRQVRQAYYGEEAQRLPRDGQDIRVMVRYPLEVRQSLDSLSNFRIRTPDGREIALEAVADVTYAPAVQRIDRTDRKRAARVRARIRAGSDAGPLRQEFFQDFVPTLTQKYPGVNVKRRGEDQEQQEFIGSLLVLYGLALFGMYMLLAIAFGSYFQPMMIMSAIPFGFMGALFGHLIMGENFAMFSMFGICAAGGVVVNDNLVLVDYVNRLRREGAGAFAALVEAGTVRFRPILLTSVTTFIGLVPILSESSFDAQFLRPMVIALAFGVLFALFVTLIFVPALYAVGVDIARFYRWVWTGEKQPPLGEGDSKTHELPDIDPDEPSFTADGQPAE